MVPFLIYTLWSEIINFVLQFNYKYKLLQNCTKCDNVSNWFWTTMTVGTFVEKHVNIEREKALVGLFLNIILYFSSII